MREFYGRGTRTGTQISVEIPIPGHEPAREALLARDGTRDMNGHIVKEALQVRATQLVHSNSQITAPTIAGTKIVAKHQLHIENGELPGATLYYRNLNTLNELSKLNSSSNERATVSGGVASCSALPDPPAPSAGSAGGSCSGDSAGDCRCAGDLICGISGSSGGCCCYCANQCGA